MMIDFSQNRFDANIQAFSGFLDGDLFVAKVEMFMLLVAVHYDPVLSGRRCLGWATPMLVNYKFLYYS